MFLGSLCKTIAAHAPVVTPVFVVMMLIPHVIVLLNQEIHPQVITAVIMPV